MWGSTVHFALSHKNVVDVSNSKLCLSFFIVSNLSLYQYPPDKTGHVVVLISLKCSSIHVCTHNASICTIASFPQCGLTTGSCNSVLVLSHDRLFIKYKCNTSASWLIAVLRSSRSLICTWHCVELHLCATQPFYTLVPTGCPFLKYQSTALIQVSYPCRNLWKHAPYNLMRAGQI